MVAINDFYLGGRQGRWPLGSVQVLGDPHEAAIGFQLTGPRPVRQGTRPIAVSGVN
jgi:hypothetical protein